MSVTMTPSVSVSPAPTATPRLASACAGRSQTNKLDVESTSKAVVLRPSHLSICIKFGFRPSCWRVALA
ncbi:hypothetical protein CYMTET_35280 [Cymbomonas tetramitiformis]|uniref:Uncharacterized protein n=1 Tax=Cymbomonas tetramitiformis TaxID=36881 RepID=A0AAE0KP24_9CHLO|nr:hypothetical protein CYMTET_35280 [Cymbomonas tetramitiformis]